MIVRLDPDACRSLLGQVTVGRVAASIGALPAIRTVRFAYTGDEVVFRVAPASRLRKAVDHAVVAFSADHCDDDQRSGWSVWIQGMCGQVGDAGRVLELQSLPLPRWGDDDGEDVFMSIPIERLSGETIRW